MHLDYFQACRRNLFVAALVSLLGAEASADPTISSFSPAFGSSTDTTPVIILGSGFFPGTLQVRFNNTVAAAPLANAAGTQIQVFVPAAAPLGSGPIYVSVNGTPTYSLENFTVIGSGPYISNFLPFKAGAGASVTINGAHFTYPLTVKFNGMPVSVPSGAESDRFSVTVPAGVTTGPISVTTTAGTYTTASNFYAPPKIIGFAPTNGRAGMNVVITGTNFLEAYEVRFGGITTTNFTVLSNNAINVVVPTGVTNGPIWLKAPQGQVNTEQLSSSNFVVLPTITGFSPNFGSPGTSVTITGANLNEGTGGIPQVRFNGVPALTVTNVTFNHLTAIVPNGATTGKISVTTTNGSGTNDALFYLPPKVVGFSPATNPPGSRIMITGTNFTGATGIKFHPAQFVYPPDFTVTNDNIIGVDVPYGIITGPISVIGPAGTGTSLTNYYAPPGISYFFPPNGLPGQVITIYGNSFQGLSAIRFSAPGGYVSAQKLSPPVPSTYVDVVVPTNGITGPINLVAPGGVATSATDFLYNYETLEVTVTDTPDPVFLDSLLTYNIQVKNQGPGTAANVVVTNILPAGVTFVGASAGTTDGGITTANLGTLALGGTANLSITAIPTQGGVTIADVTSVRSGLNPVPYSVITTTDVANAVPQLSITLASPDLIELSWPLEASNYTLQTRTNLAEGAAWSNVLTPPTTNGNSLTVTLPNTGTTRFYRLKP